MDVSVRIRDAMIDLIFLVFSRCSNRSFPSRKSESIKKNNVKHIGGNTELWRDFFAKRYVAQALMLINEEFSYFIERSYLEKYNKQQDTR